MIKKFSVHNFWELKPLFLMNWEISWFCKHNVKSHESSQLETFGANTMLNFIDEHELLYM